MITESVKIDENWRITLPENIINALGIKFNSELIIELSETVAIIKSKDSLNSITEGIASMNLPVSDWEQMEKKLKHYDSSKCIKL